MLIALLWQYARLRFDGLGPIGKEASLAEERKRLEVALAEEWHYT